METHYDIVEFDIRRKHQLCYLNEQLIAQNITVEQHAEFVKELMDECNQIMESVRYHRIVDESIKTK